MTNDVRQFAYDWAIGQRLGAIVAMRFAAWYSENYPDGDKSVAVAYWDQFAPKEVKR